MELIDKSAVVAEIENLRKHYIEREDFDIGWNMALDKILSFLDTLEVKEVDTIEREVKEDAGGYPYIDATELYDYDNDKPLAKAGDRVKVVFIKDK